MFKIRKNIFVKILALIISLSFVLGTSIFLIALREESKNLEDTLVREGELFSQILAQDIEAGYLVNILKSKSLFDITPFKEVRFLWIVQPDGIIYFADDSKIMGKEVKDSAVGSSKLVVRDSIFHETGERVKLLVRPLKIGGENKGWTLFMGISLDSVRAARKRMILASSIYFILALIVFILISFYFARKITNPLSELKKGVEIIGRGNFDYQIKLKTEDEIRDLGNSFNEMTRNLKQYYNALREEELKTSAVFKNFADGLLVFDKKDNLILINPKVKDFFGKKTENLIGKSLKEIFKFEPFKHLAVLYKKNKEIFREELKIRDNLILEATIIPLKIENRHIGNLMILHDITREKLIERTKTEFVSLAAHQLRTPLSAIKWITKMLLDEELGKINKEQKEFLQDSYKSNERMIHLINALLNVAQIEEGKYIYNISHANLQDLVQAAIDFNRKKAKGKKIEIIFEKPKKRLPKIPADIEKIKVAIANIIDNAITYSPKGEKIIISLKRLDNKIQVSVKDNGIGIPKKEQPRIFNKFFRGARAIKKETRGNGLGLYISKNIIEAHKGKIWFKSKEGQGTTFFFTFPIDTPNRETLK